MQRTLCRRRDNSKNEERDERLHVVPGGNYGSGEDSALTVGRTMKDLL